MKNNILNYLIISLCLISAISLIGCKNTENQSPSSIENVYDIIVENGYEGTFLDWQTSLTKGHNNSNTNLELRVYSNNIEWRYTDSSKWNILISVNDAINKYTPAIVSFRYDIPQYLSNCEETVNNSMIELYGNKFLSTKQTKVEKGSCIDLYDFSNCELGNYFLGWFIVTNNNEILFNEYTTIGRDLNLIAKFDTSAITCDYLISGEINLNSTTASKTFNFKLEEIVPNQSTNLNGKLTINSDANYYKRVSISTIVKLKNNQTETNTSILNISVSDFQRLKSDDGTLYFYTQSSTNSLEENFDISITVDPTCTSEYAGSTITVSIKIELIQADYIENNGLSNSQTDITTLHNIWENAII